MHRWKRDILWKESMFLKKKNIEERRRFNLRLNGGETSDELDFYKSSIHTWMRNKGFTNLQDTVDMYEAYSMTSGEKDKKKVIVKWIPQHVWDYYAMLEDADIDFANLHAPYKRITIENDEKIVRCLEMESFGSSMLASLNKAKRKDAWTWIKGKLDILHDKGFCHGDIIYEEKVNWGNVLLHNDTFRFIDFGIAVKQFVENTTLEEQIHTCMEKEKKFKEAFNANTIGLGEDKEGKIELDRDEKGDPKFGDVKKKISF